MGLKILFPEPDQASQETLTVDIVAVHGLNGDPTNTWTHTKTKAFWLKDFLHHDLKGARIMTFGYDADVAFGNTTADIKDHAVDLLGCLLDEREDEAEMQRPIIFIAHSLGGIIVKEALTWAHVEPQYSRIKESTLGIVFFGTPHQGSEKADYGKVLVKVVSGVMVKPKSKLVNALQCHSETLMDLTSKFKFPARSLQIAAFYELKPTGIVGLIVEKHSALLEIENEDQVPVAATHQNMCKFGSRDNETYKKLVKRLKRMLKSMENASNTTTSAQKHIQSRAPHNKYFEVPRNVSSIFTGREDICRDLQERCLPSDPPSAQKTQKRFVLHGLGGSGKTQICLKFAQDHRESFYGVFFIDASSASRAEQGFSAMAERCQVGKRMDDFKRWLTNLVEDWLLIIDNADDPSLDILQYFPTGCRGTVVVTTRNRDCAIHATVGSRDIGAMDFGEAISLLLKASGEQETETLRGRALPVVEILWSLALAIVQAGAVIRQKLFTFEEYCHAYSTRRKELHKFRSTQASSDYKFTVYTTWEVSRESIRAIANGVNATEEASQNATNALELLNFFGFCHFDDIWDEFFRLAWENMPEWSISGWWETNILQILRQDQRPEKWDPSRFRQAMSLLSSYSLIEWSEHRVSLHPLVHSWIRDSLNKPEQLRHWTSSVSTLAMMISTYKEQPYSLYKRLMPHVQSCLGVRDLRELLIEDGFAYVRASITYHLFTVYAQCFQPGEILLLTESAVEYTRKILGDEETLTWITVGNNAWAHNQLHQYQETIDKLSTRAEVFLSSPSLLTRPIACAIYRLISAYNNSQLTKQALKLGEKLVPLCIEDLGEKDEFTCGVIQELARSYSDIGRTNEAVELCESVVNRQKTFLSDKDDILLRSKYLLAVRYISTGRYHKAVDILRHVVKIRKKVFGDDNIDTLISQAELAKAYNNLGQPGTGIPLLVTAIGVGEKARLLNAGLQAWRITLARCQANEAKELWKNGTKPFRPEVVISLLVEAIQSGEKNGLLDAELQGWRRDLAAFQAHKADC